MKPITTSWKHVLWAAGYCMLHFMLILHLHIWKEKKNHRCFFCLFYSWKRIDKCPRLKRTLYWCYGNTYSIIDGIERPASSWEKKSIDFNRGWNFINDRYQLIITACLIFQLWYKTINNRDQKSSSLCITYF